MAATYKVLTQYPTSEYLGGQQSRDVMAVGILTQPSQIYLEFRIPKTTYTPANVRSFAVGYSGTIEAIAAIPGVEGVTWSQEPTPQGELQDIYTLTVASTSGNSFGFVKLPPAKQAPAAAEPLVAALRKQLDDVEGS